MRGRARASVFACRVLIAHARARTQCARALAETKRERWTQARAASRRGKLDAEADEAIRRCSPHKNMSAEARSAKHTALSGDSSPASSGDNDTPRRISSACCAWRLKDRQSAHACEFGQPMKRTSLSSPIITSSILSHWPSFT
eukprot:1931237-Pleurochrysis_carterae.AAC.1